MFEEDNDEVGADIEAYCPKCKGDTAHTVITKYEDEIRRVQCSPCGDVHAYRKPRGEVEDDIPEPVAARKRALTKKPTWQEAMDKAGNKGLSHARPYSIRDHYKEGDVVTHPKFGYGFVTEIFEMKCEVTFQDERRVLVHNRPDLAAQMPAIASIPAPREDKKKGQKGKKAGKGGALPPPAAVVSPPPVAAKGGKGKVAMAVGKAALAGAAAAAVAAGVAKVANGKAGAAMKAAPAAVKQAAAVVKGKVAKAVERVKAVASKKEAAKAKSSTKPVATSSKPVSASSKPVAKPAAKPAGKPAAKSAKAPARAAQAQRHAAAKGKKPVKTASKKAR